MNTNKMMSVKKNQNIFLGISYKLSIYVGFLFCVFILLSVLFTGCGNKTALSEPVESSVISDTANSSVEPEPLIEKTKNQSGSELLPSDGSKENTAATIIPVIPTPTAKSTTSTIENTLGSSTETKDYKPSPASKTAEPFADINAIVSTDNLKDSTSTNTTQTDKKNESIPLLKETESVKPEKDSAEVSEDTNYSSSPEKTIVSQEVALSLSSDEIRQGDVVAVWVNGIPATLDSNKVVMIKASWLKNPIKADFWNGYYVVLIQATVSVNPNTYSVRALYKTAGIEGQDDQLEEVESTKTLIKIVKRQFEQQIFSVSKELEEKRSPENINNDAEKVAVAKSNGSTVPLWNGSFSMPIPNQQAKSFGKQRIINGKLNYTHSGVDISGKTGTHILAPAAGKVVFAGELVVAGNTVILDHGLGMYSSLVHMSKIGATVGQLVQPGDLVGYVGETGFATGPHLHWTLTVHGNITDPEFLIAKDPLEKIR